MRQTAQSVCPAKIWVNASRGQPGARNQRDSKPSEAKHLPVWQGQIAACGTACRIGNRRASRQRLRLSRDSLPFGILGGFLASDNFGAAGCRPRIPADRSVVLPPQAALSEDRPQGNLRAVFLSRGPGHRPGCDVASSVVPGFQPRDDLRWKGGAGAKRGADPSNAAGDPE